MPGLPAVLPAHRHRRHCPHCDEPVAITGPAQPPHPGGDHDQLTEPDGWPPTPQGRSGGHLRSVLLSATAQLSRPPPFRSACPLTRRSLPLWLRRADQGLWWSRLRESNPRPTHYECVGQVPCALYQHSSHLSQPPQHSANRGNADRDSTRDSTTTPGLRLRPRKWLMPSHQPPRRPSAYSDIPDSDLSARRWGARLTWGRHTAPGRVTASSNVRGSRVDIGEPCYAAVGITELVPPRVSTSATTRATISGTAGTGAESDPGHRAHAPRPRDGRPPVW